MTDMIRTPWTPEQVDALNRFQREGGMHPFTCGHEHPAHPNPVLEATPAGWRCFVLDCEYTQEWAHAFMANPDTWPKWLPNVSDRPEPEDTCRPVEVDGETIRVRGTGEMTPEAQEALTALVRAAKAKMAAEPQPIHQQIRAVAFNAVAPALNQHGEWLRLTVRRTVANAVLAAVEDYLDIGDAEAWCKTCRRVWDGPGHRCESDAEQRLAGVRALCGRWVQAGPPPLGVSLARWWDRRLVELHNALDGPAPAAGHTTDTKEQP